MRSVEVREGRLDKEHTAFVLIDIQERLAPAISGIQDVIDNANKLSRGASVLKIPMLVTEQYPKGLGHTLDAVWLPPEQHIVEKITFGCFACEEFAKSIEALNVRSLVIFGIEAHVCVLQTALEGVERGYEVHVVANAISSRKKVDKDIALSRMQQDGIYLVSTEMVLFQLLKRAGTDGFRSISKLVK